MKTKTIALLIVAVTVVGLGLPGISVPTGFQAPGLNGKVLFSTAETLLDSGPPCLPGTICK